MKGIGRNISRVAAIVVIAGLIPLVGAAPALAARLKTIKISDASVIEGDSGQTAMSFTVSWSGSKGGGSVGVNYATANGTATAGDDYVAKTGSLTLPGGGCRCQTISVQVKGDTTFEGTETFLVNLSNASNATIGVGQGIGTIYDNEGPPAIVALDATVAEGGATLSFPVQLTSGSLSTVTVDAATTDGTATAGQDYTATATTVTFASGQMTGVVNVPIAQDSLNEDDETVVLTLTNPSGAPLADAQATGTITDDDPEPTISIADTSAAEGSGTLSFTVTLSAPSGREVDVDYATTDGTATAGTDYTASSGTLAFAPGETTKPIDVAVAPDATYENDESLTLTLDATTPVNASVVGATATGTITNDDPVPTVSISDVSVTEGNAGTTTATFAMSLSNPSSWTTSVDWTTSDATASAGADYVAASGTVSFDPGVTTGSVSVTVNADLVDEPNETFLVTLGNPTGVTIGDGQAVGTIHDDDKTPTAITAKVTKTSTAVKVSGILQPAASGLQVKVTLLARVGSKYVKVATKTVGVKGLKDRNHDGTPDAGYAAGFPRPAGGAYLVKVAFAGTADLKPCHKSVKFTV